MELYKNQNERNKNSGNVSSLHMYHWGSRRLGKFQLSHAEHWAIQVHEVETGAELDWNVTWFSSTKITAINKLYLTGYWAPIRFTQINETIFFSIWHYKYTFTQKMIFRSRLGVQLPDVSIIRVTGLEASFNKITLRITYNLAGITKLRVNMYSVSHIFECVYKCHRCWRKILALQSSPKP